MKQQEKRELKEWARGFKFLSDPTRVGILCLLAGGPKNVRSLCKALGLGQPSVSHHLGLLRMGRLVDGTRTGKSVVYAINKSKMRTLGSVCSKLARG